MSCTDDNSILYGISSKKELRVFW